jgi:hypothetical protein
MSGAGFELNDFAAHVDVAGAGRCLVVADPSIVRVFA